MWVFKADNGRYLHDYKVGLYGRIEDVKWTDFQMFALRFRDRNVASVVVEKIGAAGSIKTLIEKGLNARLARLEKSQREANREQLRTLSQIAAIVRGVMAAEATPSEGSDG